MTSRDRSGRVVVFAVQEETGGIPYEPDVFSDEKLAEDHYRRLVNEVHRKSFKTFLGAVSFMGNESTCWDKWGVRIWECPINAVQIKQL